LDRFFKSISKNDTLFTTVSKSAFTQARRKLNSDCFIELGENIKNQFYKKAPTIRKWKGSRVIAIDGSILNLPHTTEIEKEFGFIKNQYEKIISARCSFAYDVSNQLIVHAILAPRTSCEKELAVEHLDHLNPKTDLLVFDRGYPCEWLIELLKKRGFKFCFRLSKVWKQACNQVNGEIKDKYWTIKKNSNTTQRLRLVSITLKEDENEVLVTNLLERETYTIEDLKELYHLRWSVEEAYKTFKKVLNIEYFTGKTVLAIKQDFHAKVFMQNLSSMIRTQGVENITSIQQNKRYRTNKTQTLAKLKDFIIDIAFKGRIKKAISQMIHILKHRLEMVRPDRSFNRPNTSNRSRFKLVNSKGI